MLNFVSHQSGKIVKLFDFKLLMFLCQLP